MVDAKLVAILGALSVAGVALYFIFDATRAHTNDKAVDQWTDSDMHKTCVPILNGQMSDLQKEYLGQTEHSDEEVFDMMKSICTESFYVKTVTNEDGSTTSVPSKFKSLDQIATYNICSNDQYYVHTFREIFAIFHGLMAGSDAEMATALSTFLNSCARDWAMQCAYATCTNTTVDTCENDCLDEIFEEPEYEDGESGGRRLHPQWTHRHVDVASGVPAIHKAGRMAFHRVAGHHLARLFPDWAAPEPFVQEPKPAFKGTAEAEKSRKLVEATPYNFPSSELCNFPVGPVKPHGSTYDDNRLDSNTGSCSEQNSCLRKTHKNGVWVGQDLVNQKKVILNKLQTWFSMPDDEAMRGGLLPNRDFKFGCKRGTGPYEGTEPVSPFGNSIDSFYENNHATWVAPNGLSATIYEPCNAQSGMDFDKITCNEVTFQSGAHLIYGSNKFSDAIYYDYSLALQNSMLGMGNLFFHGGSCGGGVGNRFDTMPMDLTFSLFLQMVGGRPTMNGNLNGCELAGAPTGQGFYDVHCKTQELWDFMRNDPITVWHEKLGSHFGFSGYISNVAKFVKVVVFSCVPETGITALDNWMRNTMESAIDMIGEAAGTSLAPSGDRVVFFDWWMCKQLLGVGVGFVNALLYQEEVLIDHRANVNMFCVDDSTGVLRAVAGTTDYIEHSRSNGEDCFALHLNNFQKVYADAGETRVPCKYNPHSEWHFLAATVITDMWSLARAVQVQRAGLAENKICSSDKYCNGVGAKHKYCGRVTGRCVNLRNSGQGCTVDYECYSNKCNWFTWQSGSKRHCNNQCSTHWQQQRSQVRSCSRRWWRFWCWFRVIWTWVSYTVCHLNCWWEPIFSSAMKCA